MAKKNSEIEAQISEIKRNAKAKKSSNRGKKNVQKNNTNKKSNVEKQNSKKQSKNTPKTNFGSFHVCVFFFVFIIHLFSYL